MPARALIPGPLSRLLLAGVWALLPTGQSTTTAWGQAGDKRGETQPPLPAHWRVPPAPALSPEEELRTFRVQPGFVVELVACEPMVQDPVAITFDECGRLWVAEMRGYMRDVEGADEGQPHGRISVLEDTDGDGRADRARVFLDGLVLPRALARVYDGLLFAADGQLWFAPENPADGTAGDLQLVDPEYVTSGNVEHQPNGLLLALDNWIYNAKSKYRYRRVAGTWIKDETEFRGQWGISQDDYGRLFYNYNYSQLHADVVPPNAMNRNPHHKTASGLGLAVTTNQAVFPIRMNTGVNRGYRPGILDDRGRLRAFASACAPCVYRGGLFPSSFDGNAFVAGPGANLVKRNIVREESLRLTSEFAYENEEFLASTDERFRPVQLQTGPDGALYVADMYRGIVQHRQYMTSHLRREILARGLDQPIHRGRIWRIRPRDDAPSPAMSAANLRNAGLDELVATLAHRNGFWRDTAQRLLIERADPNARDLLAGMAVDHPNHLARIHALWTLEGLGASRLAPLEPALFDHHPQVQVAALRVCGSLAKDDSARQTWLLERLRRLSEDDVAPVVRFHLILALGDVPGADALPVMMKLVSRHGADALYRDGTLSGLAHREMDFLRLLLDEKGWNERSPGRQLFLAALASALYKEGNPRHLAELLRRASEDDSESAWRRHALWEGLAQNARGRRPTPVVLMERPSLRPELKGADPAFPGHFAQALSELFAWPGHEPVASALPHARPLTHVEEQRFRNGQKSFLVICAGCHGAGGEGLSPLAPPLVNSSWVLGSKERLARILLQGLEGPIHVNGTKYEPPLTLPNMPSLASLEDEPMAEILTYVRRAWGHAAAPIAPEHITSIRESLDPDAEPLTEDDLLAIE